MKKQEVLNFDVAFADARKRRRGKKPPVSIFLGNGFSIAASKTFAYDRLLDRADFGGSAENKRIKKVAKQVGSADFEAVVRRLQETSATLQVYPHSIPATRALIRSDARHVRTGLTNAISKVHPAHKGIVGQTEIEHTIAVLKTFDDVFTVSYDLLLYWAMAADDGFQFLRDGFGGRPSGDLTHVNPGSQNVHYLHGALHLWEEVDLTGDPITYKLRSTWLNTLVQALQKMLAAGRYPLVVMEGTTQQKRAAIERSPYLRGCFENLRQLHGSLFTFGWAMNDNDKHLLRAIADSSVTRLYVGIYGGQGLGSNPRTIGEAAALSAETDGRLNVTFWNVASAGMW